MGSPRWGKLHLVIRSISLKAVIHLQPYLNFRLKPPPGGFFYTGNFMSEPLTATASVAAGSTGVALATWFPEATPAVSLCALAGTLLYVITTPRFHFWKQMLFAAISFIGGVYGADTAAEILAAFINGALSHISSSVTVNVSPAVGALVASTVSVAALLKVLARYRNSGNDDRRSNEDK